MKNMPMQRKNIYFVKKKKYFSFLKPFYYKINFISLQCIVKFLYVFETLKTKEFNTTLFDLFFFMIIEIKYAQTFLRI